MTGVRFLGREGPLEEEAATHSSILNLANLTDRGAWWATVHVVTKSHTRLKRLSTHTRTHANPV